ncbi:uncharacterized protein LOC123314953 isoform X2 [Coccinella septempunctata]|nr:uncharacterized protein LOC123314953 isoform X2 [Coccinella septempunctata]
MDILIKQKMNMHHIRSNSTNNSADSFAVKDDESDSNEEAHPIKTLPSSIEMTECSTESEERKTIPSQDRDRIVLSDITNAKFDNLNRKFGYLKKTIRKDHMTRMEKIINDFDKAYAKSFRPQESETDASSMEMINLSSENDKDRKERIGALMSWNIDETKKFQTSDEGIEISNQKQDVLYPMSGKVSLEIAVDEMRMKFKQFFADFDMKTDTFKTPQPEQNVFDVGSSCKKPPVPTPKGPKMTVLEIIENSRRSRHERLKMRRICNSAKRTVPVERHFDKDGSCLRIHEPGRTSAVPEQKIVDPQQVRSVVRSCLRVFPRTNIDTNDLILTEMTPNMMTNHFGQRHDDAKDSNIHTSGISDRISSGTAVAETSVISDEISNIEQTSMDSDLSHHLQDSPYGINDSCDRYYESNENLQTPTSTEISSEDNLLIQNQNLHFSLAPKSIDNLHGINTNNTSVCKQNSKVEIQASEVKYDEANLFAKPSTSYEAYPRNISDGDRQDVNKSFIDVQNLSIKKEESKVYSQNKPHFVEEDNSVNLAESNNQQIDHLVVPCSEEPNSSTRNSQNEEDGNLPSMNGSNLPSSHQNLEEHSIGPSTRINHYSVDLYPSSPRKIIIHRKNPPNEHDRERDGDFDGSQGSSGRKLEGSVQFNTFSEEIELKLQNIYSLPVGDITWMSDTGNTSHQVFPNLQSTCMYNEEMNEFSDLVTVVRLRESDIGDELNKLGSYEDFVASLLFNTYILTSETNQTV